MDDATFSKACVCRQISTIIIFIIWLFENKIFADLLLVNSLETFEIATCHTPPSNTTEYFLLDFPF
jgi:hypothetical protein